METSLTEKRKSPHKHKHTYWKDDVVNNCDLIIKQGDDVALPEVPTQPVPELPPEAAEAEPGTATVILYDSSDLYLYFN